MPHWPHHSTVRLRLPQVTFAVGGADVSVTPFWSGHCPGSAAFLFHNTHLGRVLHTGDWRLEDLCVRDAAGCTLFDLTAVL